MSKQKIIPIASLIIISGAALLFFLNTPSTEESELSQTFFVEGVFHESQNYVEIHFIDKSQNTNSVILEILGMEESFQKTYQTSEFIEIVPFQESPKYGWAIHPITLIIDHNEYGQVNLKTEIHSTDEPVPPVIFSIS